MTWFCWCWAPRAVLWPDDGYPDIAVRFVQFSAGVTGHLVAQQLLCLIRRSYPLNLRLVGAGCFTVQNMSLAPVVFLLASRVEVTVSWMTFSRKTSNSCK